MSVSLVNEIFAEVHKVLDDAERQGLIPAQIRGKLERVKERFLPAAAEAEALVAKVEDEASSLEEKLAAVKTHKEAEALADEVGVKLPPEATKVADKVAFIAANAPSEEPVEETPATPGEGATATPADDAGAGA